MYLYLYSNCSCHAHKHSPHIYIPVRGPLFLHYTAPQRPKSTSTEISIHGDCLFFQVLLRAKENEILYLKKEISCLRNEVASLTKVCASVWYDCVPNADMSVHRSRTMFLWPTCFLCCRRRSLCVSALRRCTWSSAGWREPVRGRWVVSGSISVSPGRPCRSNSSWETAHSSELQPPDAATAGFHPFSANFNKLFCWIILNRPRVSLWYE